MPLEPVAGSRRALALAPWCTLSPTSADAPAPAGQWQRAARRRSGARRVAVITGALVTGGGFGLVPAVTLIVNRWVSFGSTPLLAVSVTGNAPTVVGVPARVVPLNVIPGGSVKVVEIVGAGTPDAV